ncbi:MAG: protein translocase subunit SecF [bacterium]
MQLLKNTNFDFIRVRYIAYTISAVVILAGIISLIVKGGPNWGVDFKGGVVIQAKFDRVVSSDEIRSVMEKSGISQISVQRGASPNELIISTPESETSSGMDLSEIMKSTLINPSNPWKTDESAISIDKVNPSVGRDLVNGAIKSILFGLILILVYMAFRFEFRFGVGGIVALFHDVAVTLGIFSLLNEEIDLTAIAAFLTIIGFSINDTIVIFDRVRENMKLLKGKTFDEILNISINQTLSRTIITTGTSLLTVIAILIIAKVGTLYTLSLALLIGFISGVYSTLFIASPIARVWHISFKKKAVS